MKSWKKYAAVFTLSMASTMEYRMNFLLSLVSGGFAILIQYFVWTAVYRRGAAGELFGYRYHQMIVYIIMAGVLSKVMATGFEWGIASDIKDGGLSKYLVQPVRYLPCQMMGFFGQKVIQIFMVGILSFVVLNVCGFTAGVGLDVPRIGLLAVTVFLALLLNCFLFYSISALAFWVTEVWAIFVGLGVAANILSGGVFPLDVFGPVAQAIFRVLPFQYVIYFPLNILTGKYDGARILEGICLQCVWILLLSLLAMFLWKAGMRKYIAVGG
ncbi:MAG: ABC-2 family transporter protein [Clostridium sp.]|nr:ABC-2 family transporter protein [Clostridium sp.]